MKKLLRILPYLTMVWVAMYVNKETGEISWSSDFRGKYYRNGYQTGDTYAKDPRSWATKKQCMKAAKKIEKDGRGDFYALSPRGSIQRPKTHKPVCYRLTKYSTR